MASRPTIIRPPPDDPSKSPIENVLEVTELGVLGPDIFTNTRQPWHPPGARGIYGGSVIAQCVAAAQQTIPEPKEGEAPLFVHSCHCYFLLAGSSEIPILFHVERVRDGRSFATRTVQARQKGRCIFTTTVSFTREGTGGKKQARHAKGLPEGVKVPGEEEGDVPEQTDASLGGGGPIESRQVELVDRDGTPIARVLREKGREAVDGREDELKCRMWSRARGRISAAGGHQAHLNALAYLSDSYFIGTVSRVHRLWRFPVRPDDVASMEDPVKREKIRQVSEFEGLGDGPEEWKERPTIGMMVSLDHSIYFHEPRRIRADEWMFSEMETPWAGDGRGLVIQKIFARDGTLLATCVQEGVMRLRQDEEGHKAKL